jgi:hypothetical protein
MKASLNRLASASHVSRSAPFVNLALARNSLSELLNRIANVTASGSPSLTSAAAFHTQLRSEPTFGESFISGTTRYL